MFEQQNLRQEDAAHEEALLITQEMLVPKPPKDERVVFEQGMSHFPLLIVSLIILNVAIYLVEITTGALISSNSIIDAGALSRERVLQGELWRLFSAAFLHGSWSHLIGNSLLMYILGMANEHAYGLKKTGIILGVAALCGSLLSIIAGPGPSVGASGAIFGLMGSLVVLFILYSHLFYVRDQYIGVFIGIIALFQIIAGFSSPYIDNYAHIGGLIGGALAALVLQPVFLQKEEMPGNKQQRKLMVCGAVLSICVCALWLQGSIYVLQAEFYLVRGMPEKVVVASTQALEANKENHYVYLLRGSAYLTSKHYDEGMKDLEMYFSYYPDDDAGLVQIADIFHHKLEKYDAAIEYYSKAVEIRPDKVLYNSRGYAKILKGDIPAAQKEFSELVKKEPRFAPGFGNLGLVYAIQGDYAKAVVYINKSVALDADLANVKKLVEGLENERKGQKQAAVVSYTAFINSVAKDEQAYWLAEIRFAQARVAELGKYK